MAHGCPLTLAGIANLLAVDPGWDHRFAGWKTMALFINLIASPTTKLQIHHPRSNI
jgi:hypothetical protein